MAGHSHAANIKHRKAAVDAKRGKIFTRYAKLIMACVREKGKDPAMNPGLRLLIDKARGVNMPNDSITRAIKKGAGELGGGVLQENLYEGYATNGVAIILEVLTDNPNRTAPELKHLFNKYNGNLGEPGCVSWDFNKVGIILIPCEGVDEEELMMVALEAGADDVAVVGDFFEVTTPAAEMLRIQEELSAYELESAEVTMVPNNLITLGVEDALKVLKFVEAFEDHDDVKAVHHNLEITEEIAVALDEAE
jgi:YebC/PmpR family DNA-binding regulatory protein